MSKDKRVDYRSGSLYQRSSDGRWIAVAGETFNANGDRKRVTVSGPGCLPACAPRCPHRAAIKRKQQKRKGELDRSEVGLTRPTVKQWADEYLKIRVRDLSPKAYNAAANPIRNWVVPTIGRRRLDQLKPADVRAVHDACRDAGRQAGDVHRALRTMLERAVTEGHVVSPLVLKVKAPAADQSDRAAMTVDEGVACLREASELTDGTRWVFTLLYGARLGECLGLTWDAVDLDAGEAVIEWQLQPLPYRHACNGDDDPTCGKKRAADCPRRRFRVPDGYEARHLVDAYHLVRPKSRKGYRVAPLLPFLVDGLRRWQEVAPSNPWGLVWPEPNGRPRNDKHDRAAWWALQERAGVHHPTRTQRDDKGRETPAPYHVHECRNFAATMLLEAKVPEHVVTDLLGHTALATSLRYRTVRREPLREAMERVGERLQLG